MNSDNVWNRLGFFDTPYRKTPLGPTEEDERLYTRRTRAESETFLSAMDSKEGSVVVVSGDIGIGKTSFVNMQQYLLEAGLAGWGPRLLPCLKITSLTEKNVPVSLARQIVHDAVYNIETYCALHNKTVPTECHIVKNWLSHRPSTSGYQITSALFGIARSVSLPPVGDSTLDTWRDILEALAVQVRGMKDVNGFTICMDNAETLTHSDLATLLMAYRDTLFSIPGIWWILIGQTQLYKEIDEIDRRVSQRISGNGIELSHFTVDEFHDLIQRRVRVYGKRLGAVSPLSKTVYDLLFQAAHGEVRFVFDIADTIVQRVVTMVRETASKTLPLGTASPQVIEMRLAEALAQTLIDNQIPDDLAKRLLMVETKKRMEDIQKVAGCIEKLRLIRTGSVSKNDFRRFGFSSAEGFVAFLEPLWERGILGRQANTDIHTYHLKGFAWLGNEFGLL